MKIVRVVLKRITICDLCSNLVKNKIYNKIDEEMNWTFQALLLELNSESTRNLFICQECIEGARKCLAFKCSIVNAQISMLSMACMKKNVKYNMTQIFDEYRINYKIKVDQDLNILCRFCLDFISADKAVALGDLLKVTVLKGFPEMDISTTETSIVCVDCWNSLQYYLKFAKNLLQMKCRTTSVQKKAPAKAALPRNNNYLCPTSTCQEKTKKTVRTKPKNRGRFECFTCAYKCNKKDRLRLHMLTHRDVTEMFRCTTCSFKSKYQTNLSRHNRLIHGNVPKIFKCSLCSYKSKTEDNLEKHLTSHQDVEIAVYECDKCSYITKIKSAFNEHMTVHRGVKQSSQTQRKHTVRTHKNVVKNMHKCDKCSYKTKRKHDLTKHMVVHKNVEEIAMYQCDQCSYKTKRKNDVTRHIKIHQDVARNAIYECYTCSYKTKSKSCLKSHMLVHQKVPQNNLYECDKCSVKTKRRDALRKHMLVHQHVTEIPMYACDICIFITKRKGSLKKHIMRFHPEVAEGSYDHSFKYDE